MQIRLNRRWLLASYPEGMPVSDNWVMDTQPVPDPGSGQILVKSKWLSVDPYMRGRMSPGSNYTKGVALGEVMQGGGVGEVVASNHPGWKIGDIAESMSVGWQEWSLLTRADSKFAVLARHAWHHGLLRPARRGPPEARRHRGRVRRVRSGRSVGRPDRKIGGMPRRRRCR